MWEHAIDYGALLVFAEHRYYGRYMTLSLQVVQNDARFLPCRYMCSLVW